MRAKEGKLCKVQVAVETFCVASGAKVNWCKSMVFWVSMLSCHCGNHTSPFVGFKKDYHFAI